MGLRRLVIGQVEPERRAGGVDGERVEGIAPQAAKLNGAAAARSASGSVLAAAPKAQANTKLNANTS